MDPAIKRELPVPPIAGPPLDPDLFAPSDVEMAFLREAISPDDDALKRIVTEVQKESYVEYPYRCIRIFDFVSLRMYKHPMYTAILEAGKQDPEAIFLDLGCCMGTDVRKLTRDGFPAERTVGCDIREAYITLGHKLYSDNSTSCPIHFIVSDILDLSLNDSSRRSPPPPSAPLQAVAGLDDLVGKVKYIYTGSLFHLFNEETQLAIALRLIVLLKEKKDSGEGSPGNVIFGRQRGAEKEGTIDDNLDRDRYIHSSSSWEKLWRMAFTLVAGQEYAENNVVVRSELRASDGFYWSVELYT